MPTALQSEVQGRVAHHYPDTDTLEIEQVRLRSFSPEGRVTLASARQGVESNADGSQVQLRGEARVTREALRLPGGQYLPRLQFEGEFLHAWTQQERVRSHLPVTLLRERDRFSADSMEFDNLTQVLHMQGRVRGETSAASALFALTLAHGPRLLRAGIKRPRRAAELGGWSLPMLRAALWVSSCRGLP